MQAFRELWMVGSRQYGFRRMDLRGQSERPSGSVVADGDRTRYQGGAYEVREASGRFAPTWVVPQDVSLVPNGAGLYFFIKNPQTGEGMKMILLTKRWRSRRWRG